MDELGASGTITDYQIKNDRLVVANPPAVSSVTIVFTAGLGLTLVLPHGPNPSQAVAFPDPIIDPPDGEIQLPRDPEA